MNEDIRSRKKTNPISNNKFGWTVVLILAVLSVYFAIHDKWSVTWILSFFVLISGIVTLCRSNWLQPINNLWYLVGKTIEKITTPVILFVVFSVFFIPVGLLRKVKRKNKTADDGVLGSFWISGKQEFDVEYFKHMF